MDKTKIIFFGTTNFSLIVLKELVSKFQIELIVTKADKQLDRHGNPIFNPVKQFAIEMNIPFIQPEKIMEDISLLHLIKPDYIVTAAYGKILPVEILLSATKKALNVHASILPNYRGGSPIHHAIINGEKETGISIIEMVDLMDAGDIFSIKKTKILDSDTALSLETRLAEIGAEEIVNVIEMIDNGTSTSIPQDEKYATFAYNLKKDELFINFNKEAKEVRNFIRALSGWPTAVTIILDEVTKIYSAEVVKTKKGKAGEIIAFDDKGILVSCLKDAILLTKIQRPGKNALNAKDFFNGEKRKLINTICRSK